MSNEDMPAPYKDTVSEYDLINPNTPSSNPDDKTTDTDATTTESNFVKDYQNSTIPQRTLDSSLVDLGPQGPTDCIQLYNADTGGGDLISTLITNDELQRTLKINNYRPDYLEDLEKKLSAASHTQFDADFYTFKVCHLATNADIIAGHLWPKGESPMVSTGKFAGTPNPNFGIKRALAIRNGEKVSLYDNVKVTDNSATGAEVLPCSANLEDTNVRWKCFLSAERDANNNITGERVKEYLFSLDGGAPKVWEGVKDQNGNVVGAPAPTPESENNETPQNPAPTDNPEAAQPTIITADSIAARAQAEQIKFQSCGALSLYASQPWYSEMESSASRISLDLSKVNQGCHSQNGNIVTLITDQPTFDIYRYDILTQKTERANQDEATRTQNPPIPAQKFGKRIDNTITLQGSTTIEGCTHTADYTYDFVNNVIHLKNTANSCG